MQFLLPFKCRHYYLSPQTCKSFLKQYFWMRQIQIHMNKKNLKSGFSTYQRQQPNSFIIIGYYCRLQYLHGSLVLSYLFLFISLASKKAKHCWIKNDLTSSFFIFLASGLLPRLVGELGRRPLVPLLTSEGRSTCDGADAAAASDLGLLS